MKKKTVFGLITSVAAAAFLFTGVSKANADTTLTVGASPTPHAKILEHVKPELKKEGIDLKIKKYDDYIIPNKALANKEIDANYFQHTPFLNNFNDIATNKKHLKFKHSFEAKLMPRLYKEGKDAAYVINANYAVQAGLNPSKDAIALEKKSSPYANIIAVRKADKNKPAIKKLVKALESKDTQNWIKKEFKGGVLPAK